MFNTSFIYNLRFYNLGNYKKVNVLYSHMYLIVFNKETHLTIMKLKSLVDAFSYEPKRDEKNA